MATLTLPPNSIGFLVETENELITNPNGTMTAKLVKSLGGSDNYEITATLTVKAAFENNTDKESILTVDDTASYLIAQLGDLLDPSTTLKITDKLNVKAFSDPARPNKALLQINMLSKGGPKTNNG